MNPINTRTIGLPRLTIDAAFVNNVLALVYTVIAAFAILFIVRAALLYVTHGSDPQSQRQARDTIIYAVAGLIGSTLVFSILLFINDRIGK